MGIFWKLCIVRCAFVARHIVDTVHVVCGPVESSNKVYETVCLSVCLIICALLWQDCCCGSSGQERSVDSCTAGAQQKIALSGKFTFTAAAGR